MKIAQRFSAGWTCDSIESASSGRLIRLDFQYAFRSAVRFTD
jgi:hypothetical protein